MSDLDKIANLSTAALKLYQRVCDPGNWYPAYAKSTPKAMKELVDAGLVVVGGRVVTIQAAYVPKGTAPLVLERYPI